MLEHKVYPFDTKAIDLDESTFEGHSAGIGNRDDGNDVIEPGAFKRTIRERVGARKVKFLDQHSPFTTKNLWGSVTEAEQRENPKHKATSGEDVPTHFLWSLTSVSKADPQAQIALRKMQELHLDGLSIGYKPIKVTFEWVEGISSTEQEPNEWDWFMGRAIRHIKELAWWEHSAVVWGMNQAALVIPGTVKALIATADEVARNGGSIDEQHVKDALLALRELLAKSDPETLRAVLDGRDDTEHVLTDLERAVLDYKMGDEDRARVRAMFAAFIDDVKEATPEHFTLVLWHALKDENSEDGSTTAVASGQAVAQADADDAAPAVETPPAVPESTASADDGSASDDGRPETRFPTHDELYAEVGVVELIERELE